ncbi:metal-dependent hydrolase [Methanolobus sp. ZRKC3]|uniref:metal-dependent hydrolase n=1 Tax=Methanolobus sp. ZRKC3 TaxID=3125786 RepID=UPI0032445DBD
MNKVRLTWLGHSCFEIFSGKVILIDPFIDENPVATVSASELDPDIIAVTHGHSDHLGDTVEIAKRTGCTVVCIHEVSQYLKSKGIQTIGMNIGGTVKVDDISFTMTDARHSSSIDESEWSFDGGRAAGFVITINDISIYHAGDTGLFRDMELISELYKPDVAIVPIGGRYTMDVRDAAVAVRMLQPKLAIPMHYNTFEQIEQDPIIFRDLVKTMSNADVLIMDVNEQVDI